MRSNLVIAGVGGQGTVLAARLVARAAMEAGLSVRTSETIGMAQRGGSVVSHVRIADAPIASPLMPPGTADTLLGFEPGEAVRCLPFLKPGGAIVVNSRTVAPVTAALAQTEYSGPAMIDYLRKCCDRIVVIDGDAICADIGSPKVINVALIGAAAAAGALGLTIEQIENALRKSLRPKLVDMNVKALHAGARAAGEKQ
ncbi:MAG TPA: indolepyruvate oxidoreductase subunit beta [Rhodocyclaceae bacterium]